MNKIILASASPRRQELIKLITTDFQICVSNCNETVPSNLEATKCPEYLAILKATEVSKAFPNNVVIGADTSVIIDNEILGKPKDSSDAYNMLKKLSGKTHQVITGCAIVYKGIIHSFSSITKVEFYPLEDETIKKYVLTSEPYDKAGGYGIQAKGGLFVKKIDGDYYNVVGLPVAQLNRELINILSEQKTEAI